MDDFEKSLKPGYYWVSYKGNLPIILEKCIRDWWICGSEIEVDIYSGYKILKPVEPYKR